MVDEPVQFFCQILINLSPPPPSKFRIWHTVVDEPFQFFSQILISLLHHCKFRIWQCLLYNIHVVIFREENYSPLILVYITKSFRCSVLCLIGMIGTSLLRVCLPASIVSWYTNFNLASNFQSMDDIFWYAYSLGQVLPDDIDHLLSLTVTLSNAWCFKHIIFNSCSWNR